MKKFSILSEKALQQIELLEAKQLEMLFDKILDCVNVAEFEKEVEALFENKS